MRTKLASLLAAAPVLLLGAKASAQGVATSGFALDRFEPTPAGDPFFAVQSPDYARGGYVALRAGVVANYGYLPLVVRNGADVRPIISHMVDAHLQLQVQLLRRIGIDLALPFSLFQAGARQPESTIAPQPGVQLGDLRLGARVRLFGEADRDPFSLHVGGSLALGFLGIASQGSNSSNGSVSGRAFVAMAGVGGPLRWAFHVGYHGRPQQALDNPAPPAQPTLVGSELFVGAALGVSVLDRRLTIGPEVLAATSVARPFDRVLTSVEVDLGAHYRLGEGVLFGLGGGLGLMSAPGNPVFRAIAQVVMTPEAMRPVNPDLRVVERPRPAAQQGAVGSLEGPRPDAVRPAARTFFAPDPASSEPVLTSPSADRDNDGVFDFLDRCPEQPRGAHPDPRPERAGCPAPDADGDGVIDEEDRCPSEAQGSHPDVRPARHGCPLQDQDNDNVPDDEDHCPTQAGAPSVEPDRNGCPGGAVYRNGVIEISGTILFATGRDAILPASEPVLQAVVSTLAARPDVRRLSVEGHTDDVGNEELNVELSRRRAMSVMVWLLRNGVDPARLEYHGFGPTRPLQAIEPRMRRPALAAARGRNRRVEFRVTDPAPAGGPAAGNAAPPPLTAPPPPPVVVPAAAPNGAAPRGPSPRAPRPGVQPAPPQPAPAQPAPAQAGAPFVPPGGAP